ncbi:hypothetical protein K8T06_11635 [bacterium]|nr:hypothetical protein [bacterium]
MSDQTEKKISILKSEWFIILLIFLIAFITGFYYTKGRLQENSDKLVIEQKEEVTNL